MNHFRCLKGLFIILVAFSASTVVPLAAADEKQITECESRCQPLSGEERYRCIRTCLSSKRKAETVSGKRRGGTYQECKDECSSLTGLDSVKCIRTCMENGRKESPVRQEKKVDKPAVVTACESRCEILSGELKDKCLARCKKEKYGEYRDPLRFTK